MYMGREGAILPCLEDHTWEQEDDEVYGQRMCTEGVGHTVK